MIAKEVLRLGCFLVRDIHKGNVDSKSHIKSQMMEILST